MRGKVYAVRKQAHQYATSGYGGQGTSAGPP